MAEEQAKINEALTEWVEKNAVVKGAVAYVVNPPGPMGLAAEERGDIYVLSLRSVGVDLNAFLREFARKYDVSGGGHKKAAGGRVPKSLFENLIDELNWYISRQRQGLVSSQ